MEPAPISFTPLFRERVWGGRALQEAFGKPLPALLAIGESWEVVDREDAQSVVASGPLAGTELQRLWREDRERIFGARARDAGERFPILLKLLDARETLSIQVHPPPGLAAELGGEAKSELWYVVQAKPGAHLFAGLCAGVGEERLAAAMESGEDASQLLHRIDVEVGDVLLIPSGRVHSLGAGCLVVEIQQNSDTTFRVFDFDRRGPDGEPRELHVTESLACIDFEDVEPALHPADDPMLAATEFFRVTRRSLTTPEHVAADGECAIVCVLTGDARCGGERFGPGSFFLVPADAPLPVAGPTEVLVTELP